jgi:3-oxoacyl-[acyl-carrier-protein] synthase-1
VSSDVVVAGVGMMTAVGLTSAETAASVRADVMRFTEIDFRDQLFERFSVAEVPEDGLPPLVDELAGRTGLTQRERRMLRLGTRPLRECVAPIAARGAAPPLVLALPDTATQRPLDAAGFLRHFGRQCAGAFDGERSVAFLGGRAGGLAAVGSAVDAVATGQFDLVVAGGIETYRDLYVLGTLDKEQRVKSSSHLDGFVPGEGAAFLLLTTARTAAVLGLNPLARLSRVATSVESGHLYSNAPYRGEGLAATLRALVASGAGPAPFEEVYSSMNGEHHWAKEWGVALMRNREAFAENYGMHHPADCAGDTGAACGPVLVGLAAIGMRQRYRRSPCLVYCSSDNGPRAAMAVSHA